MTRTFAIGMMLATTLLTSGCSSFNKQDGSKDWSISDLWKKEYQKPQSMAAIWTPDVLSMPGKPATRGFGGRLYFYNERSQAIPVDGDLVVHGYRRSTAQREASSEADKKFAFTAEQMTAHFTASELGASYSIWIPWDAADGVREEIALVPTFVSKDGMVVQGAPAKLYLPGREDQVSNASSGAPIQTVSYSASSMPTNAGTELPKQVGMKTTTIEIPRSSALSRPPASKKARTSFLLNAAAAEAGSSTPVQGKPNSFALEPQPPATPTAVDTTVPSRSDIRPKLDVQSLSPPTRRLPPAKSPIGYKPWSESRDQ